MIKVNKIKQIVRLKHVLKKWKNMSLRCSSVQSGRNDSDFESGHKWKCTPSGTLPVYVGAERRRFVIPTEFLNMPIFVALLNQAGEEFGYRNNGGLTLLCDVNFFEVLLEFLERDEERFKVLSLEEFLNIFSEVDIDLCKETVEESHVHLIAPMMQKSRA
ncbi:auxin-responsive protein SAUR71-like [Impatiens glandulifera]|uniref:auxin-responsive protein SAUR71-like n=1 Tax=Impatiens glandulifera TaxID=253017 RepID=UPI001FB0AB34|nr:auxin-responsive protein SAUR71-like [Impatiens glandulifera]